MPGPKDSHLRLAKGEKRDDRAASGREAEEHPGVESERPGKFAREHFYFALYFGSAIDAVPRLRLI